jgi:hypothetical protein
MHEILVRALSNNDSESAELGVLIAVQVLGKFG